MIVRKDKRDDLQKSSEKTISIILLSPAMEAHVSRALFRENCVTL